MIMLTTRSDLRHHNNPTTRRCAGIRVNAVAPGPIWTPLIPATFPKAAQPAAGQPSEVAPAYVLLASEDGSYMNGQVLHPNGGIPVSS